MDSWTDWSEPSFEIEVESAERSVESVEVESAARSAESVEVELEARPARLDAREVGRDEPSQADPARSGLDHYLASLRGLEPLSPHRVRELSMEMREQERRFRDAVYEVPATAIVVLERWRERREQGLVTGVLCHRYRDDSSTDWTRLVNEAMFELSEQIERLDKPDAKANRSLRRGIEREISSVLRTADIRFEILQDIALELARLLEEGGAGAARKRKQLRLGARRSRSALERAQRALALRDRARQTLASHNLRLVVHIAKRYQGPSVPLSDLIQEGSIGLLRAVDKFDASLGYRFSTYAVWWIEQAMIRTIQRQSRTVRLPSNVFDAQIRYRNAGDRLRARISNVSHADLAAELGISEEQLDRVEASLKDIRSIDAPLDDPDGQTLGDRLSDPSEPDPAAPLDRARLREVLDRGLGRLGSRERKVLRWRFGLDEGDEQTLQQIGARLGLSRERVRQIQASAMQKLRKQAPVAALREMLCADEDAAEVRA